MNQKGFTFIEFGLVIIMIALLLIFLAPTLLNFLDNSKEKTYKNQIQTIENAATRWSADNIDKIGNCFCKNIEDFAEEGYLSKEIKNPKTGQKLEGYIKISYDEEYNQYNYKYKETCEC